MNMSVEENSKTKNQDYLYEFTNWEDENVNLKLKLLRGIYSYGFEKPSAIQIPPINSVNAIK